jgi:hypothetical protein
MAVAEAYAAALAPDAGGDIDAFANLLSDDFQNLDQDGNVALTKDGFLGLLRVIGAAFSHVGFVATELYEEDDFVVISGHTQGVHTADLDLSGLGLGVVPASGKMVVWPDASARLTIVGDKVTRLEPHAGPAGVKAFLMALGVEISPD